MRHVCLLLALTLALPAAGQGTRVLFVEPDLQAPDGERPAFRPIADPTRAQRLRIWTSNEAASLAIEAFQQARKASAAAPPALAPELLVVAILDGEASTGEGFRLRDGSTWKDWPHAPYLRLGEDEWRFGSILLHETGHACLVLLARGRELPRQRIAPIPHATAALTDRMTAFTEGFATSLEAIVAQRATSPAWRARYHHDDLRFGTVDRMLGEYFRPSAQLATYAQALARHQDVRDNVYAFASAFREGDYLRTQLDPARDLATLRDANQLLQSEGFVASTLYALLLRGQAPGTAVLQSRLGLLMQACGAALAGKPLNPDTALLLEVFKTYARLAPNERAEVLSVLLDLSRGVLLDAEAAPLWRRHYLAALHQDLDHLEVPLVNSARQRWLQATLANPDRLGSRLGPQLPVQVQAITIRLPGMGVEAPLGFDLNTAEEGVLRLIPGISEAEVGRWLSARQRAPFASTSDFRTRVALRPDVLGGLEFSAEQGLRPQTSGLR